jgi:hypothetical protein
MSERVVDPKRILDRLRKIERQLRELAKKA